MAVEVLGGGLPQRRSSCNRRQLSAAPAQRLGTLRHAALVSRRARCIRDTLPLARQDRAADDGLLNMPRGVQLHLASAGRASGQRRSCGTPIEVVVVSYDPKADSPVSWSQYRRKHRLSRSNWHFLTGTPAGTRQFAEAIQFRYWSYDEHVVHDFRILMIRPDGEIAGSLDWETRNRDFFAAATNNGTPDKQGSKP